MRLETCKCKKYWWSFRVWKSEASVEVPEACILSSGQLGATPLVPKNNISLGDNDPTSHSIYYLSKQFSNEFMVSIPSFKCSAIQHNVHWGKCGHIEGGFL